MVLQVISEVFCWSRNPMEVRRLSAHKEELYSKLAGNHMPPVVPGVPLFLETLLKHNVSCFCVVYLATSRLLLPVIVQCCSTVIHSDIPALSLLLPQLWAPVICATCWVTNAFMHDWCGALYNSARRYIMLLYAVG